MTLMKYIVAGFIVSHPLSAKKSCLIRFKVQSVSKDDEQRKIICMPIVIWKLHTIGFHVFLETLNDYLRALSMPIFK